VTNDNASPNSTAADEAARRLRKRGILTRWEPSERKLSCLGHVVELGIDDFMSGITQTALVNSKQALWEFDPQASANLINDDVDIIALLRTLAIKVSTALCSRITS
ncbi:hypothetical protein C8Q76DRAFT_620229, partial [Earliella scabrosa]